MAGAGKREIIPKERKEEEEEKTEYLCSKQRSQQNRAKASRQKKARYNLRLACQARSELVEVHIAHPDATMINELARHIDGKQRALIRLQQPATNASYPALSRSVRGIAARSTPWRARASRRSVRSPRARLASR